MLRHSRAWVDQAARYSGIKVKHVKPESWPGSPV